MFLRAVRYCPRRSCGRICPVGELVQPFLVARLVPGYSCECALDIGPLELLIQPTCDGHIACGSCMRARQGDTSAFCDVAELLQLKVQQPLQDARMCSKKSAAGWQTSLCPSHTMISHQFSLPIHLNNQTWPGSTRLHDDDGAYAWHSKVPCI